MNEESPINLETTDKSEVNPDIPNEEVLRAFGVSGEPIHLEGGQGTCFRIDNLVFKPTRDVEGASWLAGLNDQIPSNPDFRIPKPVKAEDGSWVFQGWTASEFVQGETRPGQYSEAIDVCKVFHKAIADIPKSDFFDKRTDVWAIADKIAWGELPLPDFDLTNEPLKAIMSLLKDNELPSQVIHGDWGTGNILFDDTLPPAVIDISPYYRPADFPIAVMMIDALVYEDADLSILDLSDDIKDFDQLLLRALLRRTCEYIGHEQHPENTEDRSPEIQKHLNLIEPILKKIEGSSRND